MNTAILVISSLNLALSIGAGILAFKALRRAKEEGEKVRLKASTALSAVRTALDVLEA